MKMVHQWLDKPIDESMSKEELLAIIDHLAKEIQWWQKQASEYRKHVDFAAYILDPDRATQ